MLGSCLGRKQHDRESRPSSTIGLRCCGRATCALVSGAGRHCKRSTGRGDRCSTSNPRRGTRLSNKSYADFATLTPSHFAVAICLSDLGEFQGELLRERRLWGAIDCEACSSHRYVEDLAGVGPRSVVGNDSGAVGERFSDVRASLLVFRHRVALHLHSPRRARRAGAPSRRHSLPR